MASAVRVEDGAADLKLFGVELHWWPRNVNWTELQNDDSIYVPKSRDLWVSVAIGICLFIARRIWERSIAYPIGKRFKLHEKRVLKVAAAPVLEDAFRANGRRLLNHEDIVALSKKMEWTPRQVERWWRRRKALNKPSDMQRFQETSWRFLFYFIIFWSGIYILHDKPWFWDTRYCWNNYPKQDVTPALFSYYLTELGFYISLVFSLLNDVRRKDFLETIIHHVSTIFLMMLSWSSNTIRIGTLVLCLHDVSDNWMEGAKMLKYLGYHQASYFVFIIFTVLWFVTRIVIYPYWILLAAVFECHEFIGFFLFHVFFIGLLVVLLILNHVWFFMILRMIWILLVNGKIDRDERSDSEAELCSAEEMDDDNSKHCNNNTVSNGNHSTVPLRARGSALERTP